MNERPPPRLSPRLLALCLAALLLSGCIRSLYQGDRSVLRPEIVRYSTATETPKPGLAEVPPAAAVQQPVRPAGPSLSSAAGLLPGEMPPAIADVPPAASVPVPPRPPQPVRAAAPRRLAIVPAPDHASGDQVLVEDTTWRGEVLVTGVVMVAPHATLTIEPGTVVRFGRTAAFSPASALLVVQGRLVASGTRSRPILFTSRFAEPIEGDWQGIVLLGSEKSNVLENCRIEGAETGLDASFSTVRLKDTIFATCTTGARLQDTVVTAHGGGANGCDTGLVLADSEADLFEVMLSGNGRGVVSERSSLLLSGGIISRNETDGVHAGQSRVKIAGVAVSGNGTGLTLVSSQGTVSGCTIADNRDTGLSLAHSRVRVSGNTLTRNGIGLKVQDGTGAAWGNALAGNVQYDLLNAGSDDFRAMGNWWGAQSDTGGIPGRICDRQVDIWRGRVLYQPVLDTKPATAP